MSRTTDYAYDNGHNRTSKTGTTYVIGDGANGAATNQIISTIGPDGTTVFYWYDTNGNRIYQSNVGRFPVRGGSSSSGGVGAGTYYEYDNENRLIGIQGPAGSFAYAYDYRTRRVQRGEPGGTTCIVFDGGTSSFEYLTLPMAPSVRYVRGHNYGGGVGGLEYTVRGATARINCYNSRGDVVAQRIGTAFSYQAAYEAFGLHPGDHGSTPDRQKASTKEEDPTGLLNEGFRYRDPITGTFLTRDPLGFIAGPNMYTYVKQNPWTKFDPEGLADPPTTPPPPPPPPPQTTNSKNTPSTKQTAPPNQPASKSDGSDFKFTPMSPTLPDAPKLSLNMQSKDQQTAAAAKDLGLTAPPTGAAPTTSAKETISEGGFYEAAAERVGGAGIGTSVLEQSSTARWTVGAQGLDSKLYTSGWGGGSPAGIETFKIGEIAHTSGIVLGGLGVAVDAYGLANGDITRAHFGANFGMAGIGAFGGPPGILAASVYFGIDTYYPTQNKKEGGFVSFARDLGTQLAKPPSHDYPPPL